MALQQVTKIYLNGLNNPKTETNDVNSTSNMPEIIEV